MMARVVLTMTYAYVAAAIERSPAPSFETMNREVLSFYFNGFKWIWTDNQTVSLTNEQRESRWGDFFTAIMTSVLFWGLPFSLWFALKTPEISDNSNNDSPDTYQIPLDDEATYVDEGFSIRLIGITTGERGIIFRDEFADLKLNMCAFEKDFFELIFRSFEIYYTDLNGNTLVWNDFHGEDLKKGQCRKFVIPLNDS